MPRGPSSSDPATGSWSGLRWRLATLCGVAVLLAGAVQGLVLLQLHPELSTSQVVSLAMISLAAAAGGSALVAWLAGDTLRPLLRVRAAAAAMASGQVPPPLDLGEADGDVATLAGALDDLGVTLRTLLEDLRTSGLRLGEASGGLRRRAVAQGATSGGQAQAMRRASANADSLVEVTLHAAREAASVIDMTHRAETLSGEGLAAVEQAVRSSGALGEQVRRIAATMGDLSERTLQVGEIVTTVKDLAEQSNLLAFNASIEAAKAGEHGRGFAAVAMEMRNLAEQSRQAAVQVRSILGEIQKYAREAALATEEGSARAALATGRSRSAGQAIEGLAAVIRESAGTARAIADRTRQQAATAADLVSAIAELSEATRTGAEDSAAQEDRATEVAAVASRLAALSGRFRS
jgi:methyl-accepting chemotaxis protein